MAWLYRQYSGVLSRDRARDYGRAEGQARRIGADCGFDPEPVEPWESRAEAQTAQGGKKDWNATRLCNVWPR